MQNEKVPRESVFLFFFFSWQQDFKTDLRTGSVKFDAAQLLQQYSVKSESNIYFYYSFTMTSTNMNFRKLILELLYYVLSSGILLHIKSVALSDCCHLNVILLQKSL